MTANTLELRHLELGQLSVSRTNMRSGKRAPDVADLLPSVRARGIIVPLLVRPAAEDGSFEIVAGRRRYHAALALVEEGVEVKSLPCAIMGPDDDAAALEASIIENHARRDPDDVAEWVSFTRLVKEGRSVAEISNTFGHTELEVRRVLALGNLLPRIRELYRRQEIDAASIRHLTLASREKQAEWLALYRAPDQYAPTGSSLKQWLFGGQPIATGVALFDVAEYDRPIVADLFGEDSYFSDTDAFWRLQWRAIEVMRERYRVDGWSDVVVVERCSFFNRWEHDKVGKCKGGKVYLAVSSRGEVTVHEGWLTIKEARKRRGADTDGSAEREPAQRSELTASLRAYADLHRHAAVRAELVRHPTIALRLLIAHAIAGSLLWSVRPDPLRAPNDVIAASLADSTAQAAFAAARQEVFALLALDPDRETLVGGDTSVATLFAHMVELPDVAVLAVAAIVIGETLAVGSPVVESVGTALAIDMALHWTPDRAFVDLLRNRSVLTAILKEVGDDALGASHAHEKGKTQRTVLADMLAGTGGREKVTGWTPRWLRFPAASYLGGDDDVDVVTDREEEPAGAEYADITIYA